MSALERQCYPVKGRVQLLSILLTSPICIFCFVMSSGPKMSIVTLSTGSQTMCRARRVTTHLFFGLRAKKSSHLLQYSWTDSFVFGQWKLSLILSPVSFNPLVIWSWLSWKSFSTSWNDKLEFWAFLFFKFPSPIEHSNLSHCAHNVINPVPLSGLSSPLSFATSSGDMLSSVSCSCLICDGSQLKVDYSWFEIVDVLL